MKEEIHEIVHKLIGSITPIAGLGNIFRHWLEKQDKSYLKEIDSFNEICSHADKIGERIKELVTKLEGWTDEHMPKK